MKVAIADMAMNAILMTGIWSAFISIAATKPNIRNAVSNTTSKPSTLSSLRRSLAVSW